MYHNNIFIYIGMSSYKVDYENSHSFEFRLISTMPTRNYIDSRVPKKIKNWIGIK